MDAINAMLSRRSHRKRFLPELVPQEILERIVECGLAAPSSKGARPCGMHVLTSPDTLTQFADAMQRAPEKGNYVPHDPRTGKPLGNFTSSVDESADILRHAPAAIFIENRCPFSGSRRALLTASRDAQAAALVGFSLELIGIGAAVQNMWICAVASGLSGLFMGDVLIAEQEIIGHLAIQGDLYGVLVLGYASTPLCQSL